MKENIVLIFLLILVLIMSCTPSPRVIPEREIEMARLDAKYQKIKDFIGEKMYGRGGLEVLTVAYKALQEKKKNNEAGLVGLEDLWAHALQEGAVLFNKPDKLWGKTTAQETSDMLGQTTIGPWQITIWNVKDIYGPPYGVKKEWSNAKVYAWCRERPLVQAKMITDYIQKSYEDYGKRSPYAIQRYFWLEAYVKGEIGQGEWTKSPVAKSPTGRWQDLTPEMKRDTGFYAKQVLLGNKHNPHGLLFWLWVTGDIDAIKETLRTWKHQKKLIWQDGKIVPTDEPGNFAIKPEDVIFCDCHPEFKKALKKIVKQILEEKEE
ncbi:hypothetical protein J7M23_07525 [Candidatus Sumerlaeota bacterium]|nr:hypothetical protein [Candidatus Sumerlaeota bacterium]